MKVRICRVQDKNHLKYFSIYVVSHQFVFTLPAMVKIREKPLDKLSENRQCMCIKHVWFLSTFTWNLRKEQYIRSYKLKENKCDAENVLPNYKETWVTLNRLYKYP